MHLTAILLIVVFVVLPWSSLFFPLIWFLSLVLCLNSFLFIFCYLLLVTGLWLPWVLYNSIYIYCQQWPRGLLWLHGLARLFQVSKKLGLGVPFVLTPHNIPSLAVAPPKRPPPCGKEELATLTIMLAVVSEAIADIQAEGLPCPPVHWQRLCLQKCPSEDDYCSAVLVIIC